MDLTHNNYLKSYSTDEYFTVEVEYFTNRVPKTYYEETKIAAEIVWNNKLGPLHLFYSGGKDSEYVLQVFKTMGMNIKPVIISTQYNQHDVKYAFDFCNNYNIEPLIIEEDYDEFVNSEKFNDVLAHMPYGMYHYVNMCHWMTKIDGTFLTGTGHPWIKKGIDKQWHLLYLEIASAVGKFIKNKNLSGTNCFLSYTAEQVLGFLNEPLMIHLVNDRLIGKTGSESSKLNVYNSQSDFVIDSRPKYDGFEIIEKSEIFNHRNIKAVTPTKSDQIRYCLLEHTELTKSFKTGFKMSRTNTDVTGDNYGLGNFSNSYITNLLVST